MSFFFIFLPMTVAVTGTFGFDVRVRGHRGKIEMLNFGSPGKLGHAALSILRK